MFKTQKAANRERRRTKAFQIRKPDERRRTETIPRTWKKIAVRNPEEGRRT